MTTQTILTAGYNHPDVAVKLSILKDRHSYSEARAASLRGKRATLAVVSGGVLKVVEGTIREVSRSWATFIPKGYRSVSEAIPVSGIIGHEYGYKHTAALTAGALDLFDGVTVEEVRAYLVARELEVREDESRQTMVAIDRVLRDVQTLQAERQAADARILASLGTGASALGLAA